MDILAPAILDGAAKAADNGMLSLADAVCRMRLTRGCDDPRTRALLARIAREVGRPDVAARLEPDASPGALNAPARVPEDAPERFLLIRSWGYGFWADVSHVLSHLVFAEITGRTPVVHWGRECMFSQDGSADAWRTFFEPVSDRSIDDFTGRGLDFFPPVWNDANLHAVRMAMRLPPRDRYGIVELMGRPERVCVATVHTPLASVMHWLPQSHPSFGVDLHDVLRASARKYLRPLPSLVARVDAFEREHLAGRRVVALHIRGSDKATESRTLGADTDAQFRRVHELLAHGLDRVFLLTDSTHALARARAEFGERLVSTEAMRTAGRLGLHYAERRHARALGEEVLIDAYAAARCERFVGLASSNVSFLMPALKDWAPGACELLGETMLDQPNAFILGSPARANG